MRIWDSELLAAEKADVVRDGLLSWVDFQDSINVTGTISRGAITGTITDRVTGYDLTIKADKNGSSYDNKIWFEQVNGFLVLHPTNTTAYGKIIAPSAEISGCKAIEVVYNCAGANNRGNAEEFAVGAYTQGVVYNLTSTANKLYAFSGAFNTTNNLIGAANPVHVYAQIGSSNRGSVYLNGTQVGNTVSAGKSSFSVTKLMMVSLKGTTETQSFRIGSIRLYNRVLTQDELRQNIQYEVKKGRLTL